MLHDDLFDTHIATSSVLQAAWSRVGEPKPENAMKVALVGLAVPVRVTIARAPDTKWGLLVRG